VFPSCVLARGRLDMGGGAAIVDWVGTAHDFEEWAVEGPPPGLPPFERCWPESFVLGGDAGMAPDPFVHHAAWVAIERAFALVALLALSHYSAARFPEVFLARWGQVAVATFLRVALLLAGVPRFSPSSARFGSRKLRFLCCSLPFGSVPHVLPSSARFGGRERRVALGIFVGPRVPLSSAQFGGRGHRHFGVRGCRAGFSEGIGGGHCAGLDDPRGRW
jgi:hypothetical protein